MGDQSLTGRLAAHPFARSLPPHYQKMLALGACPFDLAAGAVMGREGEPALGFYLLESGYVNLYAGTGAGCVLVQSLGPGETVGWSWLVPPYRWQFGGRAETAVRGISFSAAWLRELCERDHDFGYAMLLHLLGTVADRLSATRRTFAGDVC